MPTRVEPWWVPFELGRAGVDNGCGERLGRFLRQIVTDAGGEPEKTPVTLEWHILVEVSLGLSDPDCRARFELTVLNRSRLA